MLNRWPYSGQRYSETVECHLTMAKSDARTTMTQSAKPIGQLIGVRIKAEIRVVAMKVISTVLISITSAARAC
jgi:hypothetical protein